MGKAVARTKIYPSGIKLNVTRWENGKHQVVLFNMPAVHPETGEDTTATMYFLPEMQTESEAITKADIIHDSRKKRKEE